MFRTDRTVVTSCVLGSDAGYQWKYNTVCGVLTIIIVVMLANNLDDISNYKYYCACSITRK